MPDFAEFARLHPDIEMEILSSGEVANLTNREADVAIRVVYDRKILPLNLHGLKGSELFGGVYMSRDRLAAWRAGPDRKSTRLNPVTNAHLVCRLLLETKK